MSKVIFIKTIGFLPRYAPVCCANLYCRLITGKMGAAPLPITASLFY